MANLPKIGGMLELVLDDSKPMNGKVEASYDTMVVIAAPIDPRKVTDLPEIGATMTLRWPGSSGGRIRVRGRVSNIRVNTDGCWELEFTGTPELEQERAYVRGGGGGEKIEVRQSVPGAPIYTGFVVDVGERGVRARFKHLVELMPGELLQLGIDLDTQKMELPAKVLRMIAHPASSAVDLVATFEPNEADATIIRRHVLQAQLRARAAARALEDR